MSPYRRPMPRTWWLGHRVYFFFMVRELTSVFIAGYLVLFLLMLHRLVAGREAYEAYLRFLARPGMLRSTRRVDASVRVVDGSPRPLRHGQQVLLHTGTAEVSARAIVLAAEEIPSGERGWVQLYLQQPVAAEPQAPSRTRTRSGSCAGVPRPRSSSSTPNTTLPVASPPTSSCPT